MREIKLLQELKHPNVIGVRIKDPSVYSNCTSDKRFWNSKSFYFISLCYALCFLVPFTAFWVVIMQCFSHTNTITSWGRWLFDESNNGYLIDYTVMCNINKIFHDLYNLSELFVSGFLLSCIQWIFCSNTLLLSVSHSLLMCSATNPISVLCSTLWRQILR